MRAVFLGTPSEAVPTLRALADIADVALVVTRPDRPRGRSGRLRAPPVKEAAEELGLAVAQPGDAEELMAAVFAVAPDVGVVAAYGRILTPDLLAVPPMGFVNVHFSLLPRWRGASPVVRAILAGDDATGVTLMALDAGMDTGPSIASKGTMIDPEETAGELTDRLATLGADLLTEVLPGYVVGEFEAVAQDHSLATAAGRIDRDEAHVDPRRHSPDAVLRAVRAFNPRPGAWTRLDEATFKLWRVAPAGGDIEPGLAVLEGERALLGVSGGVVELIEVQVAGRGRVTGAAWMRGRRGEAANLG